MAVRRPAASPSAPDVGGSPRAQRATETFSTRAFTDSPFGRGHRPFTTIRDLRFTPVGSWLGDDRDGHPNGRPRCEGAPAEHATSGGELDMGDVPVKPGGALSVRVAHTCAPC